jgi:hypothetical protein
LLPNFLVCGTMIIVLRLCLVQHNVVVAWIMFLIMDVFHDVSKNDVKVRPRPLETIFACFAHWCPIEGSWPWLSNKRDKRKVISVNVGYSDFAVTATHFCKLMISPRLRLLPISQMHSFHIWRMSRTSLDASGTWRSRMLMKKTAWIRGGQFFHSSQPEDWYLLAFKKLSPKV